MLEKKLLFYLGNSLADYGPVQKGSHVCFFICCWTLCCFGLLKLGSFYLKLLLLLAAWFKSTSHKQVCDNYLSYSLLEIYHSPFRIHMFKVCKLPKCWTSIIWEPENRPGSFLYPIPIRRIVTELLPFQWKETQKAPSFAFSRKKNRPGAYQ